MRIHIVTDSLGNVVATLPAGEFQTVAPGTDEEATVQFAPLVLEGQRSAEVALPKELEALDSPAERHAALAEYELLFGQATLLPRDKGQT